MFKEVIGGLLGQKTERELGTLVKAYTDQGKFSGAVLVARQGDVLLNKGYGMANLEHAIPNTPQTVFRIGSMTKSFTAIAIMQLVEAGRLSVEDTLSTYLPDYPNGEGITVHHLLSNTSGIPDYIITQDYQKIAKLHVSPQKLIRLFHDAPLQFEPGSDFGYSNSGWVLLGVIMEQITAKPYSEIIRTQIFEPVEMTRSGYEWEQPIIKLRAQGYVDTGAGMLNTEFIDETTMYAAGGLYSTVEDLLKLDRALYGETLLKQETFRRMAAPVWEHYGYGWELYSLHNHRVVAHSGGLPGYVSNLVRFVDDDVTIIIASNLGSAAVPQITECLSAIVFGEPYVMPTAYQFVEADPAILADYVGEYKVSYFGRTSILKFSMEDEKLVMNVQGLPKSILSPLSDTRFYARSKGDIDMTFVRDENGRINAIDMNWAGHEQTAERVI